MRVVRAELRALHLPLRRPLRTARGTVRERAGFLVELEDARGRRGFGEALPLPLFGGEDLARCQKALRGALVALERDGDADSLGAAAERALEGAPVARNACETARLDLLATARGAPLAQLLRGESGPPLETIELGALVEGDAPEAVRCSARERLRDGYRCFKLKVGALELDSDLERVAALREAVGAEGELRLDANGAWETAQALAALDRFAEHGVALVEQPVSGVDLAGLARVREASPIPVAADEAVRDLRTAKDLLAARAVDAMVLKPPVLGGPGAALELGRLARQEGVAPLLTSFLDSSLGIRAALHVAAALRVGSACGLATADLLADDVVPRLRVERGRVEIGSEPGIGAAPAPSTLARLAAPLVGELS